MEDVQLSFGLSWCVKLTAKMDYYRLFSSSILHFIIFKIKVSLNMEFTIWWDWLGGELQKSSCLSSPVLGLQTRTIAPCFLSGCWDLNLGPQTCTAPLSWLGYISQSLNMVFKDKNGLQEAGEMTQQLRGLGFSCQYLHGSSQPFGTPGPGDGTPIPSDLCRYLHAHTKYTKHTHTHRGMHADTKLWTSYANFIATTRGQ